ncbi:Histone H2A deubiquitinase MYSM1 [Zancudomyces culisetae]|uniref:Histone H2A deubiquitinase MYSM1 n=1 Tax=Zancudomyces culisetae TaxID=1213189 RepID=A0A1R1PW42_ZANCU|nr:Histone H2A deubiquitinase MYSM1 [Zancudomyces culisetae]|eukprot:OMH85132.1 Histone H2A deubiquitinase MYSM1 [Zancudomyces culisetae]
MFKGVGRLKLRLNIAENNVSDTLDNSAKKKNQGQENRKKHDNTSMEMNGEKKEGIVSGDCANMDCDIKQKSTQNIEQHTCVEKGELRAEKTVPNTPERFPYLEDIKKSKSTTKMTLKDRIIDKTSNSFEDSERNNASPLKGGEKEDANEEKGVSKVGVKDITEMSSGSSEGVGVSGSTTEVESNKMVAGGIQVAMVETNGEKENIQGRLDDSHSASPRRLRLITRNKGNDKTGAPNMDESANTLPNIVQPKQEKSSEGGKKHTLSVHHYVEGNRKYVLDPELISDHEKSVHKEFFTNKLNKTADRYFKIRNFILMRWEETKPEYLTKISSRLGLVGCGDVNAIGRVHTWLEKIEAINKGVYPKRYFPSSSNKQPPAMERTTKKARLEESGTTTPEEPRYSAADSATTSSRRSTRLRDSTAKKNNGMPISEKLKKKEKNVCIAHPNCYCAIYCMCKKHIGFKKPGEDRQAWACFRLSSDFKKERDSRPAPLSPPSRSSVDSSPGVPDIIVEKKDKYHVMVKDFEEENPRKFSLYIDSAVMVSSYKFIFARSMCGCAFHASTYGDCVQGFLGGCYDPLEKILYVTLAYPGEMDESEDDNDQSPKSENEARTEFEAAGFYTVGFYRYKKSDHYDGSSLRTCDVSRQMVLQNIMFMNGRNIPLIQLIGNTGSPDAPPSKPIYDAVYIDSTIPIVSGILGNCNNTHLTNLK